MKIAVWDTFVTKKNGIEMHFDILVPEELKDTDKIFNFGKAYLKTKGQEHQPLTSKECKFCHIETVKAEWEKDLKEKGYVIVEIENCD